MAQMEGRKGLVAIIGVLIADVARTTDSSGVPGTRRFASAIRTMFTIGYPRFRDDRSCRTVPQSQAAKLLGTSKRVIHYKIHKYGIDPRRFRMEA